PLVLYGVTVESVGPAGGRVSAQVNCTASPAKAKPPVLHASPAVQQVNRAATPGSLRVCAYPDTEKAHPVTGNLLEEAGSGYGGAPAGTFRHSNPVWDGRTIRLSGARGEILGFHLLVEAGKPMKGISIRPPARLSNTTIGHAWKPAFTLFRDWYVK